MATKVSSKSQVCMIHHSAYVTIILLAFVILQFLENQFTLRDKVSHRGQCVDIANDPTGDKSKEYGINWDYILNEFTHFHVCDGSLVPDVMHDILEGALQYEVKLMLRFFIDIDKYFTLQDLNTRLEHIELGYMERKDRPTPISVLTFRSSGNSLGRKVCAITCSKVFPLCCLLV